MKKKHIIGVFYDGSGVNYRKNYKFPTENSFLNSTVFPKTADKNIFSAVHNCTIVVLEPNTKKTFRKIFRKSKLCYKISPF